MGYTGWALDEHEVEALRLFFVPQFPDVRGHHITHTFGVGQDHPLPTETEAVVVGYAIDTNGIEALVVRIGDSEVRPDGRVFHITWSLDKRKGFRSADSSAMIQGVGWQEFTGPGVVLTLTPRYWEA